MTMAKDTKKGINRAALAKTDQLEKAVLNKLITPQHLSQGGKGGHKARVPSQYELLPIVKDSMQRIEDADRIFDILPDLSQVAEIAISGILSSKDLITTTLVYESLTSSVPLELKVELNAAVRQYFDEVYPLRTYLYDILYDVLFKTGSYAVAIIPESSVDALINEGSRTGLETFRSKLNDTHFGLQGILGSTKEPDTNGLVGLEAIFNTGVVATSDVMRLEPIKEHGKLFITDNADVLKLNKIRTNRAVSKIASAYNSGFGNESGNYVMEGGANRDQKAQKGFDKFDQDLYKNPVYGLKAVDVIQPLEQTGRETVGHPLIMHMPSESVIPVHVPGDMKHHVGYFIILDESGNPISRHSLLNNNVAMQWLAGNPSSQIVQDVATSMGYNHNQEKWTMQRLADSYSDIVEAKLINTLKNGVYGDAVSVCRPHEVYRIMMARSLAKKATQILYIPVEQFTYFALDYNDWGVGRSLLDRSKMLSTVRSTFAFAQMQTASLNAARNLQFTITLDPDDREPEKTIEDTQHRIMEQFANRIPFTGTPDDIMAYIANAGISWNIEGNEHYPSTKITMTDDTPDYKMPEQDVDDALAKKHYRALMVDPDLIMNPQSIEFASQITSKDLINTKRICKTQERLNPLLTHFVKTYIISDQYLREMLTEKATSFVKGSKDVKADAEQVRKHVSDFVEKLSISLPPPDTSMLNSQMQAFDDYSAALDKVLDLWILPELLANTDMSDNVDAVKALVKAYLLRQWVRENNVDPNLLDVLDRGVMADNIVSMSDDSLQLATNITKFFKRFSGRLETMGKNEDIITEEEDTSVDITQDGDQPDPAGDGLDDIPDLEGDDGMTDDLDADPDATAAPEDALDVDATTTEDTPDDDEASLAADSDKLADDTHDATIAAAGDDLDDDLSGKAADAKDAIDNLDK